MIRQLQDITITYTNNQCPSTPSQQLLTPSKLVLPSISDLVSLNLSSIDFKQCIPGSVHQRKISITLKQNLPEPKLFILSVIVEDLRLMELPQYIFGVRKETGNQYFDQFKFKAMQRGTYNFVIGVKTPIMFEDDIFAKMIVKVEGTTGDKQIKLRQKSVMPYVKCCKELVDEDGSRMLKIAAIKGKPKKQTKIIFRCPENMNFTLLADMIGLQEDGRKQVDVKPRTVQVAGKGLFVLNICASFPADFHKEKTFVRKVLTLQIKDTSCFFHFPIEVVFYPEGRQGVAVE